MKFHTLFILFLLAISSAPKAEVIDNLYQTNNIKGSLLIESLDGKTKYQYNVDDNQGFIPASTFKIPNTLIILEEGLLESQFDFIKWDGKVRGYDRWNKDQTLKSAFQHSCVWCYQRYAKKIGNEKYLEYLKLFDYGNYLTGNNVSTFWLNGQIKMSVEGQVRFLRKVYSEELPVQKKHIATLKSIMLSDENERFKVWSKTGWSGESGWYVGYLEAKNHTWFFANHIEITNNKDLELRKRLVMEALLQLDIIQE
jgi:beta-lactamase class D